MCVNDGTYSSMTAAPMCVPVYYDDLLVEIESLTANVAEAFTKTYTIANSCILFDTNQTRAGDAVTYASMMINCNATAASTSYYEDLEVSERR